MSFPKAYTVNGCSCVSRDYLCSGRLGGSTGHGCVPSAAQPGSHPRGMRKNKAMLSMQTGNPTGSFCLVQTSCSAFRTIGTQEKARPVPAMCEPEPRVLFAASAKVLRSAGGTNDRMESASAPPAGWCDT